MASGVTQRPHMPMDFNSTNFPTLLLGLTGALLHMSSFLEAPAKGTSLPVPGARDQSLSNNIYFIHSYKLNH